MLSDFNVNNWGTTNRNVHHWNCWRIIDRACPVIIFPISQRFYAGLGYTFIISDLTQEAVTHFFNECMWCWRSPSKNPYISIYTTSIFNYCGSYILNLFLSGPRKVCQIPNLQHSWLGFHFGLRSANVENGEPCGPSVYFHEHVIRSRLILPAPNGVILTVQVYNLKKNARPGVLFWFAEES